MARQICKPRTNGPRRPRTTRLHATAPTPPLDPKLGPVADLGAQGSTARHAVPASSLAMFQARTTNRLTNRRLQKPSAWPPASRARGRQDGHAEGGLFVHPKRLNSRPIAIQQTTHISATAGPAPRATTSDSPVAAAHHLTLVQPRGTA